MDKNGCWTNCGWIKHKLHKIACASIVWQCQDVSQFISRCSAFFASLKGNFRVDIVRQYVIGGANMFLYSISTCSTVHLWKNGIRKEKINICLVVSSEMIRDCWHFNDAETKLNKKWKHTLHNVNFVLQLSPKSFNLWHDKLMIARRKTRNGFASRNISGIFIYHAAFIATQNEGRLTSIG